MSEFSVEIDGLAELQAEVDRLTRDYGELTTDYTVGTGVEYAVYLEFGTSKMDPKPFFRPAIAEAKSDVEGFIDEYTKVDEIESADELVSTLAFALEKRVKEIITAKGLIDTGTLRASVQAVKGGVPATDFPGADEVTASAEVAV